MFFPMPSLNLISIIDILVVAALIYKLFLWIKGTRAVQLIKGLVVLLVATTVSDWLGLYTINWLLNNIRTMVVVAIPVVFQPELRRALERIGRGKFLGGPLVFLAEEDTLRVINELIRGIVIMAKNRTGSLIVIERKTGLNDYIETGIKLDSVISGEFLLSIFMTSSPLHDGAVIIRGDRVAAAGCFLPLTENPNLGKELGTRHRAAIGITEQSDAVVLVVSEETGIISLVQEGKITRHLEEKNLREMLAEMLIHKTAGQSSFWNWRS